VACTQEAKGVLLLLFFNVRTKHEGESRVSNLCKSHKATNMGPLRHVACESGSLLGESVKNILGHIHEHCRRRC
jgi:hypothetical protein